MPFGELDMVVQAFCKAISNQQRLRSRNISKEPGVDRAQAEGDWAPAVKLLSTASACTVSATLLAEPKPLHRRSAVSVRLNGLLLF